MTVVDLTPIEAGFIAEFEGEYNYAPYTYNPGGGGYLQTNYPGVIVLRYNTSSLMGMEISGVELLRSAKCGETGTVRLQYYMGVFTPFAGNYETLTFGTLVCTEDTSFVSYQYRNDTLNLGNGTLINKAGNTALRVARATWGMMELSSNPAAIPPPVLRVTYAAPTREKWMIAEEASLVAGVKKFPFKVAV